MERFTLVLTRDLRTDEINELRKWFSVYQFSPASINNRRLGELFAEYKVVLLRIDQDEDRAYWAKMKNEEVKGQSVVLVASYVPKAVIDEYGASVRITSLPIDALHKTD